MAGDWVVEATVPGGGAYTGTVSVREVGATIEVIWDITAGRYAGLGLAAGDGWYVACGLDFAGLGLALLDRDGRLRWTPAPARGTVASTVLTAEPGLPPRWSAGPVPAPGLPFSGLALGDRGEVARAELTGGSVSRAPALATASGWAVAWYADFEQTALLRYGPGPETGTWAALWALGSHPEPATELLRPAG